MKSDVPAFAVVGRVNKGKSSIVSTLVEDDTVKIDKAPGTTRECQEFELRVGERVLCRLIDTPGFEDAPRALAWMREREVSAARRPDVVREFVARHRGAAEFREECRLLAPILEGAGILYVVDASRPYRPNYEAEMEILQWTGRPRMALLNTIASEDHLEEWRRALDQYFSIVRAFDAHDSTFADRIGLLRAFRELREDRREAIDAAVQELEADWQRRRRVAAGHVADLLGEALGYALEWPLAQGESPDERRREWVEKFNDGLRRLERRERGAVEALYRHDRITRAEQEIEPSLVERDLFAESSWRVLGLDRWQLVRTGAIGGAAIGGAVDLSIGGASLLAGAAIGSVVGALSSYYAGRGMARVEVLGRKLGGSIARIGPLRDPNFPWLLLDRALLHYRSVVSRAHARRDALVVAPTDAKQGVVTNLGAARQAELSRLFTRLARVSREALEGSAERDRVVDLVTGLLESAEHATSGRATAG